MIFHHQMFESWNAYLIQSMKILRWLGQNGDKMREVIRTSYKFANEVVDQSEIAFNIAANTLDDPNIRTLIGMTGSILWATIAKNMNT